MAINKVQYGNTTLIDLTDTTAVASDVAQGKYFYGKDGVKTLGTASGGGGTGGNVWQDENGYIHLDDEGTTPITVESLSVTQNGTYTAPSGKAYSPVTVNVSGGGGLEYETGTWTPTTDVVSYNISFANTHTTAPYNVVIFDTTNTTADDSSTVGVSITSFYDAFGVVYPYGNKSLYGRVNIVYTNSGSVATTGVTINSTSTLNNWISASGFRAYSNYNYVYFRSGRTYKWIAVWSPTT